ncbi:MAG: GSCFA domain-containing protein [Bdellovibrionota bacterium]
MSNQFAQKIEYRLRNMLFHGLRPAFFRILSWLNPDFATNIEGPRFRGRASLPSASDEVVSATGASAGGATRRVSVINDNSAVVDSGTAASLLECIFPRDDWQDFVTGLIGAFGPGLTLAEIEAKIGSALKRALADEDPPKAIALDCYKAFCEHRVRSAANARAYLTSDRRRPSAVFWPDPTDQKNGRSIFEELPFIEKIPLIDRSTAIVSAGSCFASEIAHTFQKLKFNYVVKEQNRAADGSYWFNGTVLEGTVNSSAAWGIIFNCPSFRQLVERAFGERETPKILWTLKGDKNQYLDPFRENIAFPSVEAYEANYEIHRAATRAALLDAKVLIVTPGLNEVWYFRADGSVFSRSPWRMAPSLVEHRVLTVEENVRDLQRMLDVLRVYNRDLKLIVTLSPIALHATFLADRDHVITANAHSKAVLRVAIDEFVRRNKDVFYFPSFELISYCIKSPWHPDQRHVTEEAVSRVMHFFREMYCV